MTKKALSLLLCLVLVLGMLPLQIFAAETVQIGTEEELLKFAERVNSGENGLDAVLTADITVNAPWNPIGPAKNAYSGTFDGQGHTVTLNGGIVFTDTGERYGLFNTVTGTVQNVTAAGTVDLAGQAGNTGGVAGYLEAGGLIQNCRNTAAVSGKFNIGGIAGMSKGSVSQCLNTGSITGSTGTAGGIVGIASKGGNIFSCGNTGAVQGKSGVGGIAGNNMGTDISDAYNTGAVSASDKNAGGIACRT